MLNLDDYLGRDIPNLGFGLMRLPRNEDGSIDIPQVCDMVDAFLDAGLTYFDTARAYGESESAIRKALVERYPRDSYQLATKNAAWLGAKNAEEARAFFDTSLRECGVDYFDFYLLHNIGDTRTQAFDDYDMWSFVRELRDKGLVKHAGFSMHDTAEVLEQTIDAHPFLEFVQLQVNFADWEDGAVQSRKCVEMAHKHDLPVIIMEPVRGGTLANPPKAVADVFKAADPSRSFVEWALRFAWNVPGTIAVLSGMSSIEQMNENIASFKRFEGLSDSELAVYRQAQETIANDKSIPCTSCKYCMKDCPEQINICNIMSAINRADAHGLENGMNWYSFSTADRSKASDCIECGQCEMACPQHIDVMTQLKRAADMFETA